MKGWIKLHRALKDWEWYSDINATRLLVHLLINVNYEDKKWRGEVIKAGSMVLSWNTLSVNSNLSIQKCRTAMGKLKSSNEVTIISTSKYQVVTLVKWSKLQLTDDDANKQLNNQATIKQQSNNNQITTTKEYNNYKKDRSIEKTIVFDKILMSEIEISDVDVSNKIFFEIAEKFRLLFKKNLKEKNSPTSNQDKAIYKNYVTPIRLLFNQDKITKEQLRKVYNFLDSDKCEDEKFSWKVNILSTFKLRKQFTTLSAKSENIIIKDKTKKTGYSHEAFAKTLKNKKDESN